MTEHDTPMKHTPLPLRALACAALATLGLGACGDDGGCTDATCSAVASALVINEMAGTGADFVEFFNKSNADVSIGGFGVTDATSEALPRTDRVFRFPMGTTVRAGGYFVVMLESNCPTTLPMGVCTRAEFGIGQTEGDTMFLLDANNRVALRAAYPANGAPSGRSYGRVPNGAGNFQVTTRTPGAANVP